MEKIIKIRYNWNLCEVITKFDVSSPSLSEIDDKSVSSGWKVFS